jgi:hypothetical protein
MKSHLIPDNKMEELDQDQDNVIENTNTNPFNMIGEGNTNTIS